MNWSAALVPLPHERRFVRFSAPALQLRLALTILGVTLVFGALIALNSYAAYGRLMSAIFTVVDEAFRTDLALQTAEYATVTLTLLLAYALALVVICGAYVNRLVGPTVALERHVCALKSGDFRSRVRLRGGGSVHAKLARHLNDLAEQLEDQALQHRR